MNEKIKNYNKRILFLLSNYLNNNDKFIDRNQVKQVSKIGVSEKHAFELLLQSYFDLNDNDSEFINMYFPLMINELDTKEYKNNPYYKRILIHQKKINHCVLNTNVIVPYQGFVCNDFKYLEDGRVIPQIGYFKRNFTFPTIFENNRLWMSITPNEINTMVEPIQNAHGVVCTIGLGLGYFTYMVSLKTNVQKVIVVENNKNIIQLFNEIILPQFENKNKIMIIEEDAFKFLDNNMNEEKIDYMFIDIWHDVSDGKDLYLKLKKYESRYLNVHFDYWIEKTIKYYIG